MNEMLFISDINLGWKNIEKKHLKYSTITIDHCQEFRQLKYDYIQTGSIADLELWNLPKKSYGWTFEKSICWNSWCYQ